MLNQKRQPRKRNVGKIEASLRKDGFLDLAIMGGVIRDIIACHNTALLGANTSSDFFPYPPWLIR